MKIGIVLTLFAFVLALAGEWTMLASSKTGYPWLIAIGLAATVVGSIGALYGFACALDLARRARLPRRDWKDGGLVVLGGRLSPLADAASAPFSGKPSLIYQYQAAKKQASNRRSLAFFGAAMRPCAVSNRYGALKVVGFPNMARISETPGSEVSLEHAASHLSRSKLDRASVFQLASFARRFLDLMSDDDGELRTDLVLEVAGENVPEGADRDSILEVLSGSSWSLIERSLAPGEEVTVVGAYRKNPDRIDVGSWIASPRHLVYRGEVTVAIRREIVRASLVMIAVWIFTAVVHVAVYSPHLFGLALDAVGFSPRSIASS